MPPLDLHPSERPVHSDYALERSYARRRFVTLGVVIFIAAAAGFYLLGRSPTNPADIPTIRAEGDYKQKPADPGGIDIPHQDVQVYEALESKNAPQPQIEHLLPLPEVPRETPHEASRAPVAAATPVTTPPSLPASVKPDPLIVTAAPPAPVVTTVTPAPVSMPIPAPAAAPADKVEATEAPELLTPSPPPVRSKVSPKPLTIEQIINNTRVNPPSTVPAASGTFAIQLASLPDQAKARAVMESLTQTYAAQLGNAQLRLISADIAGRGTFYRIQSQRMSEDSARQICAAIKQRNAGCILVR